MKKLWTCNHCDKEWATEPLISAVYCPECDAGDQFVYSRGYDLEQ